MYLPPACSRGGFAEHVIQRGTGRAACFFGAPDCLVYLGLLAVQAAAFECRVHAYALMGNHVHLLLTASQAAGTAGLMRAVREAYARHAREADETGAAGGARAGGALEEAYAASTIHAARHLLACMRYIELNPVRAGLVRRPGDYRWSSYGANAAGRRDALISPHPHYLALGRDPDLRCAAYRRSVDACLHERRPVGSKGTLKQ